MHLQEEQWHSFVLRNHEGPQTISFARFSHVVRLICLCALSSRAVQLKEKMAFGATSNLTARQRPKSVGYNRVAPRIFLSTTFSPVVRLGGLANINSRASCSFWHCKVGLLKLVHQAA